MGIVSYRGQKIIPAPYVNINKTYEKTGDGQNIGSSFEIIVQGTIVAHMGSPDKNGNLWSSSGYPSDDVVGDDSKLGSILRKQEALRDLFSVDGGEFEVQSSDGSQPLKCNPVVVDISFSADIWFQLCKYSIALRATTLSVNGLDVGEDDFTEYISSAEESWQFETIEEQPESELLPRTYRLSHTVNAVGKSYYDETGNLTKQAWEQARNYVLPKLGFDSTISLSSGVNNLPSYYGGYNHVRSENIDKKNGSYSVTESWLLASGTALEDFSINLSTDQNSALQSVSIQGEIRGLEVRNPDMTLTGSKHHYADVKWNEVKNLLHARAQLYTGLSLNSIPISTSEGTNPITGTKTYSYEYNNRPSHIVSDTKMESITINHSPNTDVFASIFILERANGPILQNLGTKQAKTVSVNIELVMNTPQDIGDKSLSSLKNYFTYSKPSIMSPYSSEIQAILDANNPINYGYTNVFVSANNENWNPATSQYSLNYEWTYDN